MWLLLVLLTAAFAVSAGAQCSPKNKNHLLNASFEEDEHGWKIKGDEYSVEIMDPDTDDSNGYLQLAAPDVIWSQTIRVPTKALSLCVGGLVKNTVSSPKSGWAVLEYTVLDPAGTAIKTQQIPHIKPGTHWQKLRKTDKLPAAAAQIRVSLSAKSRKGVPMEQEARFDDLFLRFGK